MSDFLDFVAFEESYDSGGYSSGGSGGGKGTGEGEQFPLDVELGRIYQAGAEGVLDCFVGCVDTQFAEDVLAVGGDGMDAGEALGGNLLGGLAQGDGLHDLGLCCRQDVGFLFFLLLGDDKLEGSLAKIA